ncbi:conserved Plasmodium protein, unknown function [Plasmodium gallinaceum]|uniref:Uncharacterized protein n=1 Tax=Plasmodium gallinaceum TaxID=5849 RepID=A0A1J1GN65_PLAGA|nr:conserved Plasmodium protein, unknown function [Plasmodium gallinaceum]CRG93771.1 conserved Plasmodium protein, unknown function [Plasmodium gallinaceum]
MEYNVKKFTNYKNSLNNETISKRNLSITEKKNEKNKSILSHENVYYSKYKNVFNSGNNKFSYNLNNCKDKNNLKDTKGKDYIENSENINNSYKKNDSDNLRNKNYISILKNIDSKNKNITYKRKSIFEEKKQNEQNINIKKKYIENDKKVNELNKVENVNLEKNKNIECFNSINEFNELKSVATHSEKIETLKLKSTIKNNNEKFLRIRKVWANLKNNNNESKFKFIEKPIFDKKDKKIPINESININNKNSTLIGIDKTKNETTHNENKKIIPKISLIKNNKKNQIYNEIKQNHMSSKILKNKIDETIGSETDNIKKNVINLKLKEINKPSLLSINKKEKSINKFTRFSPKYLLNNSKSSFKKKTTNSMSNEKFHEDLKKILINTIINPQKEKNMSDQLFPKNTYEFSKRGNISLNKSNLINKENPESAIKNVFSKNSINIKEKIPLIKNQNNFDTKQKIIRRFSTVHDSQRFIFNKNNFTRRFSISNDEEKYVTNNKSNLIHDKLKLNSGDNKLKYEKSIQLKKIQINSSLNCPSSVNDKDNYESNILYKHINNIGESKNILRGRESAYVKNFPLLNKRNITLESTKKENKVNKSKNLENKNELLSNIPKKLNTLNLPIRKMNVSNINKECSFLNRNFKTNIYKNYIHLKENINIKSKSKLKENSKKNSSSVNKIVIKNNSSISNNSLIKEKNNLLKNKIYMQYNNKENLKLGDNIKLNRNNINENYLRNNDQITEKESKKYNENKDYSQPKTNLHEDKLYKTCFYEDILTNKEEIQDDSMILLKNNLSEGNDKIKSIPNLNNEYEKLSNLNSNNYNSNEKYVSEDILLHTKTKYISSIKIKKSNNHNEQKIIGNKLIFYNNKNNCEDNYNNEKYFSLKGEEKSIKHLKFDELESNCKEYNNDNNLKKKVNLQFSKENISSSKKITNILDDKRINENSQYDENIENTFIDNTEKKNKQMNTSKNFYKLNIDNEILHDDKLKNKINENYSISKKNNETCEYINNVITEYKTDQIIHKKEIENIENDNLEILCHESNNDENKHNVTSFIHNDKQRDEHKSIKENKEEIKNDMGIKRCITKNINRDKIKLQTNSNKVFDITKEIEEQETLINLTNKKNKHETDNISLLNNVNLSVLMLSDSHIEYSDVIYGKKEKSNIYNENGNIKENKNDLNKKKKLEKLNYEDVLTSKKDHIINYEKWEYLKEKKNKDFIKFNKNNSDMENAEKDMEIKKSKSLIIKNDCKKMNKYKYDYSDKKDEGKKKINYISNNNKIGTNQHIEKKKKENIILENENHIKSERYLNLNNISKRSLSNKFLNEEKKKNAKYNFYLKFKNNYNLSVNKIKTKNLKKRRINKIYDNIFHLNDEEKNIDNESQANINFHRKYDKKKKNVKKRKIEKFSNVNLNHLKKKEKEKLNNPSEGYSIEENNEMEYTKNYKTTDEEKKNILKNSHILDNETYYCNKKKINDLVKIEEHNYEEKKVKISEECEQLEENLEKNKNIFFYEHEWMNIIFQIINNDKFYLAEKLMILIFEKEESLYKSFIEKKRSKEKNKNDYNENQTDENNINKNVNKINRELSDFMKQIVNSCPEEWPLLDIAILIIVSQIVCFIFIYNKWNFFCESCRIFEKHCIAILLNSSIINFKKNDNTMLMFEHFFFYKIIIPKNYKPSNNTLKYHTNYLKNDYLIKEKTILDVIFLALACYITISHNLNEYIEKNNIICYLNVFHKNFDKKERLKDEENRKTSKRKKCKLLMNKWGSTNSKKIKYRFSENLHKNKLKIYNDNKKKRRKTYFEQNLRKRMSILRTTKCINKKENNKKKNIHLKKICTYKEENIINDNSKATENYLENESIINNDKEDKTDKIENSQISNNINNFVLFKNNKIDTIVKYQTKTNFEKLLCLIIIEIFNLIYDSREYSVENVLIIRKFFRVFLNFAQKKFISISIHLHFLKRNEIKKNYKEEKNHENNKIKQTENDTKNINENYNEKNYKKVNSKNIIDNDNKSNNLIPLPNHIYDNYNNIWTWVERIFSENFYEINNMLYNLCSTKKNNVENNEININYEKIELISQNIKRYSSLQKHNCSILKNYWIIFGLKERISSICLSSNSLLSYHHFPKNFLHKESITKKNIFFKLEKKDFIYDTLTLYFLSWIECICKVFLSINEIPSFLHLQNKKYFMNDIINKNENKLSLFNISLKNSSSNEYIVKCKENDNNDCYEQNEKENSSFLLKQIKTKLKIYDIQWHEKYEKKYLDLLICMKIMKKKFKQKKMFKKIMKYNISSIWLNKSQIYLQYIQITINCKFFLGCSYHEIYLFIKKNYELLINMIDHNVDEKRNYDECTNEKGKKIYNEDENKYAYENENIISENILLMGWEIANFYFCILYFKLELKSILIEILKWIKFFEKNGKNFYDFFKFRCVTYILHIFIFSNKYKCAQKIIKRISHDYFKCNFLKMGSKNLLRNNNNDNSTTAGNNNSTTAGNNNSTTTANNNSTTADNNNINNNSNKKYPRSNFPTSEKKELYSHILNKCYLYDKWINFKMKKYNNIIIYLLKKKNIVKLIQFNNKNLNILIKKKKEKKLIRKVSFKMAKLQNILLSLYHLCIKLYKSYYYHSSILHYDTSQQILAASKYLNIVIKKKEIIMNYFPLYFNNKKNIKKKNIINVSNSFTDSQSLLSVDSIFNESANLLKIPSLNNEENNNYLYENNKEYLKSNIENNMNNINNNENNENNNENNENNDLFYLHALILSIQIQYTLSISIIICSDLFNFPRKLKKLKKINKKNKNVQKDNYKILKFISSLFNYKILCKHYRIINGNNSNKDEKKKKKKKKKISNTNNLYNDINNNNLDITYSKRENVDNNFLFSEISNSTSKICNNDFMLPKENIDQKVMKETNISLSDFNNILDEENNRCYNSDIIISSKNNYQELNDKLSTLSDSISLSYKNYKNYILKKKKKYNHSNKLKIKDDMNIKNNLHILIKISTWLSKNSASQLIWIAQKLFKMYLPELLCIILALQANMFKNKNILTNIKRIDRILKLCSENPQLVYFATESLKGYKNKKNIKKYKNYFEINKKYKEIFLKKKKDIINSEDILYKVCSYFFN